MFWNPGFLRGISRIPKLNDKYDDENAFVSLIKVYYCIICDSDAHGRGEKYTKLTDRLLEKTVDTIVL